MSGQNFDLSKYETVKVRKKRFLQDYHDGRLIVELIENSGAHTVMKATAYKSRVDQMRGLPLSIGYAQEYKGVGGFANKTSHLENCEESSIGRCLDNAGFSGNNKCSREEIIQAGSNGDNLELVTQHAQLKAEIIAFIKDKSNGGQDKVVVSQLLSKLGIAESAELDSFLIAQKEDMLKELKGLNDIDISSTLDEDFPIPENEKIIGPDYRMQNGKFRGKQFKDIGCKELTDYVDWVENQKTKRNWHLDLCEAIGEYMEGIDSGAYGC